ncbi:unnamed protein product [Tilletia controversa]|uniref:Nitronate monooxygenase n=3 Tax=Tilletia TaxID=13289 RepID=A0A8X7MLZ4_9BASI|nr:hypothetical protein CF336_g8365 [Tilletia laevis]KAE8187123.1 hypothetical protein CF328_g7012 [Tilletia controversa]KAE8242902.1 hypothetical protein A4X03_0g7930 [Tilletia caries]KAE8184467.1 hypothetical protein CF335_g8014 [Tilletia laevis]KAE8240389.1 hypothetical protein A4X06_0g7788 [Tilletia controversa]
MIETALSRALKLEIPVVQGGMQHVGLPKLVAGVSNAGGLGVLTALTQPSPDALRKAIRETRALIRPEVSEKRKALGAFAVNLTLLPAINPPDYEGYTRAALEEGVRIFETAGHNPGAIIKLVKEQNAYVIHKCTTIRHALSSQRFGADALSIDGFECAGHPGEDDIGGLVLAARASDELSIPFILSGGIANGQGLAAALALGAAGVNMGTRFMCTVESEIHERIKQKIVESTERDTVHIFRSLRNTARVYKNKVAMEVVALERRPGGVEFKEIQPLVSGQRGKKVYTEGDPEAGIWTAGITLGLINDIPTCEDLLKTIERDAEAHIARIAGLVSKGQQARL